MAVPVGILCNFDSNKLRLTSDTEAIGLVVVEAFSVPASSASSVPHGVLSLVGEGVEVICVFRTASLVTWLWLLWLATKTSSPTETLLALLPVPPLGGEAAASVAEGAVVVSEVVEATDVL